MASESNKKPGVTAAGEQRAGKETVLVVTSGLPPQQDSGDDAVVVAKLSTVTPALLTRVTPDCVVCDLFAPQADAQAVAERLVECGYRGRLCILAPRLPAPESVRKEIASLAPGIQVELIERS